MIDELKREWASGTLNAGQVQRLGAAAREAGAEGLDQVAATGTHGKHPQNVHRDLVKIFGNPPGAPEVDWLEVPTKLGRKTLHPVLLPHKFFQAMYASKRSAFNRNIRGPTAGALEYSDKASALFFCMRAGRCRRPKRDAAAHASAGRRGFEDKRAGGER